MTCKESILDYLSTIPLNQGLTREDLFGLVGVSFNVYDRVIKTLLAEHRIVKRKTPDLKVLYKLSKGAPGDVHNKP
jgi:chromosome segregation and condensation protein ScpB